MDQLTRIEKMLERIAVALEKANDPVVVKQETPASFEPSRLHNEDLRVYSDPSKTDMAWNKLRYDPVKDLWIDTQKPDDTDIHVWTGPTAEDDNILQTVLDNAKPEDWEKAAKNYVHNDYVGLLDPFDDDKTSETCRNKFACAIDFAKEPIDDRFLTEEESHILNRAIKRSTIKAHGGKLEKD